MCFKKYFGLIVMCCCFEARVLAMQASSEEGVLDVQINNNKQQAAKLHREDEVDAVKELINQFSKLILVDIDPTPRYSSLL